MSGQISGQFPEILSKFRSEKSHRNSVCGSNSSESVRAGTPARTPTATADIFSGPHCMCTGMFPKPCSLKCSAIIAVLGEGTRATRAESAGQKDRATSRCRQDTTSPHFRSRVSERESAPVFNLPRTDAAPASHSRLRQQGWTAATELFPGETVQRCGAVR